GQRRQPGLVTDVQVGGQERRRVPAESLDEVGQHVRSEVELVVADRDRVVVQRLQRQRVVERHPLGQAGVELRPGQEVVAGGDQQHSPPAGRAGGWFTGGGLPLQLLHQGGESRYSSKVRVVRGMDQLGLTVVVVQDGQG